MSKTPKKIKPPRPIKAIVRVRSAKSEFDEVVGLIEAARTRVFSAVNKELIDLYWQIGEYISRKLASSVWGEGVVQQLADHIARQHPNLRGFTRRNLFRMRQFFDTYNGDEKVSALLTQLSWTHNLLILNRSKRPEEREFYLRMALRERWSSRELDRQLSGALFERAILSPPKVSAPLTQLHPDAMTVFKDAYLFEFLQLPPDHSEADLHKALVEQLKNTLIELGRDYCYIGSNYALQVGNRDFFVDLLFFHRGLNCLTAIDLKIEEFQPEHLGKMEFYLETLDRDIRKPHEGPSVGIILCASKNHQVVEYALNRSMSPALIAEYHMQLPDKKFLQDKLEEFYELAHPDVEQPAIEQPKPSTRKRAKPRKGRKK